jgi:hypothetical protein
MTPGERFVAVLFGGGFTAFIVADLVDGFQAAKLSVAFIVLFWFPLLLVHELGHALTARLLGWRVTEVVIGYGPQMARFLFRGTLVVVRAVPAAGHVIPAPTRRGVDRPGSALIYLGGPAIELAVVVLVALLVGWEALFEPGGSAGMVAAQSLALTAFVGAMINLFPFTAAGSVSDGMGVLLSASLTEEHFEMRVALPYSRAAERALDRGDAGRALAIVEKGLGELPDNVPLRIVRAVCLAGAGQQESAIEELQRIRELPSLDEAVEAEALHAAALVVLEGGDLALLPEAESACLSALKIMPSARFEVTMGRIRLAQGRYGSATEILMHAYKGTRDAALEDRCLAYLSIAAFRERRFREAFLMMGALRARRPGRPLLERVERERERARQAAGAAAADEGGA